MQPQRQANFSVHALVSIRSLKLSEVIPSEIIYSSEQIGWKQLPLHVYRHQPHAHIRVPPIVENAIAMNLSGSIRLSGKVCRRFNGELWDKGNIAIYPSGESVDLECSAANEAMIFLPAPTLLASLSAEISDADPSRIEIEERINDRDPLLYHVGLALFAELRANTPAHDLYVEALTRTFALHLLKQYAVRPATISSSRAHLPPTTLRRVLEYVREHFAEDLSIERLAQEAQLSPFYFARVFKRSIGQSLHQYILEQRLELAKQLILTGDLSIGEIAIRSGFTDQSHLHRHFKRHYRMTPGQMATQRKNVQQGRKNVQDSDR